MGENFASWANMSHTSYAPIINTGIQPQMCMFKSDEKNTKIEFYYTTEMQHDIKYKIFLRKN